MVRKYCSNCLKFLEDTVASLKLKIFCRCFAVISWNYIVHKFPTVDDGILLILVSISIAFYSQAIFPKFDELYSLAISEAVQVIFTLEFFTRVISEEYIAKLELAISVLSYSLLSYHSNADLFPQFCCCFCWCVCVYNKSAWEIRVDLKVLGKMLKKQKKPQIGKEDLFERQRASKRMRGLVILVSSVVSIDVEKFFGWLLCKCWL